MIVDSTVGAPIALSVPDAWSDSGPGTWWRDGDPADLTNLDVYVWEADNAETARREVRSESGNGRRRALLESSAEEATRLTEEVLLPALAAMVVS